MPVEYPLLRTWYADDPTDPGRLPLNHPDVQRLADAIAPGAQRTDLGGVMSLNVRLDPPDGQSLVLRVHQPAICVTRVRLLAIQELRRSLASQGLRVPLPLRWRGSTVFRCGTHWAELEPFLLNQRLPPTLDSYTWLFGAMGALHRALAPLHLAIGRAFAAPYAPPGSLQRWLPITEAAVLCDPQAVALASLLRDLIRRLRRQWIPASGLPRHLVHGDVRLSNLRRAPDGETIYLDFGFLAHRPRIHDLAYALTFMVWTMDHLEAPERFPWHHIPTLIAAYEAASGSPLTRAERQALAPYAAAVPLYYAALDGFTEAPATKLRTRAAPLHFSDWLLTHPDSITV